MPLGKFPEDPDTLASGISFSSKSNGTSILTSFTKLKKKDPLLCAWLNQDHKYLDPPTNLSLHLEVFEYHQELP